MGGKAQAHPTYILPHKGGGCRKDVPQVLPLLILAPMPIKGERTCCPTDVAAYLPLSALEREGRGSCRWLFKLLGVLHVAARGREGVDVKWLQGGEDLLLEKITLFIGLHIFDAIP